MKAKDLAQAIFHKVVTKGEDLDNVLEKFDGFLRKKERTDLYPLTLRYLKILLKGTAEEDAVKIVSSHKVSEESGKRITAHITDEKVPTHEEVDNTMLGGFEAEYKGQKISMNLKKNVEQFKKHLTH